MKHTNKLGISVLDRFVEKIPLSKVRPQIQEAKRRSIQGIRVNIDDILIRLKENVKKNGTRRIFYICPTCSNSALVLYRRKGLANVIGCRSCLHINYWSNRFQNMIETDELNK